MAAFTKRRRAERAHRYRVLAAQLDFHLSTRAMGQDVSGLIRQAKTSLLQAADLLETAPAANTEPRPSTEVATEEEL